MAEDIRCDIGRCGKSPGRRAGGNFFAGMIADELRCGEGSFTMRVSRFVEARALPDCRSRKGFLGAGGEFTAGGCGEVRRLLTGGLCWLRSNCRMSKSWLLEEERRFRLTGDMSLSFLLRWIVGELVRLFVCG